MKISPRYVLDYPEKLHPVCANCERGSTPASPGRYPSLPGQVPQLFAFLRVQNTPKNPTVTVTLVTVTGNTGFAQSPFCDGACELHLALFKK